MIFLTIGTHEPFDRLVRAVDDWAEKSLQPRKIIAQVVSPGSDAYAPSHFDMIPHLTPAEYEELFCQADLIVSHAGMGSILTAFTHGKPIVIMPRRGHLHETRNDHQYATLQTLRDRPGLFIAQDETELSSVMETALETISGPELPRLSPMADAAFTDALRNFILPSKQG